MHNCVNREFIISHQFLNNNYLIKAYMYSCIFLIIAVAVVVFREIKETSQGNMGKNINENKNKFSNKKYLDNNKL